MMVKDSVGEYCPVCSLCKGASACVHINAALAFMELSETELQRLDEEAAAEPVAAADADAEPGEAAAAAEPDEADVVPTPLCVAGDEYKTWDMRGVYDVAVVYCVVRRDVAIVQVSGSGMGKNVEVTCKTHSGGGCAHTQEVRAGQLVTRSAGRWRRACRGRHSEHHSRGPR